jgi:hypothetical protein
MALVQDAEIQDTSPSAARCPEELRRNKYSSVPMCSAISKLKFRDVYLEGVNIQCVVLPWNT